MNKTVAVIPDAANLPAPSELEIEFHSLAEKRFKSPSLKAVEAENKQVLRVFIYMLISSTTLKCGHKIESDKILASTDLFLEELEDYPHLTIKEIEKAFKDGYKGNYGEYYGLNVLTFITWIDFYIKNVRMSELAKHRLNEPKQAALPELSESDKEDIIKSGCKRCFSEFLESGYVRSGNLHIYDYLNSKDLINLSEKEISDINILAIKHVKSEFNPANERGKFQKKQYADMLKNFNSDDNNARIESKINALKLQQFFKNLKKNKTIIETLL